MKCKPRITRDDIKQFWYYLKCSSYKVGYLINFGASNGVQIIRRVCDTAREKIASVLRFSFLRLFRGSPSGGKSFPQVLIYYIVF